MIIAIIQARMGSKRLPGKVLLKLNSSPLLMYQYNRVNKSKLISKIIIATSSKEIDNPIVDFCINNDINYFRDEETVDALNQINKENLLSVFNEVVSPKSRKMINVVTFAENHKNISNMKSSFTDLEKWKSSRIYK